MRARNRVPSSASRNPRKRGRPIDPIVSLTAATPEPIVSCASPVRKLPCEMVHSRRRGDGRRCTPGAGGPAAGSRLRERLGTPPTGLSRRPLLGRSELPRLPDHDRHPVTTRGHDPRIDPIVSPTAPASASSVADASPAAEYLRQQGGCSRPPCGGKRRHPLEREGPARARVSARETLSSFGSLVRPQTSIDAVLWTETRRER